MLNYMRHKWRAILLLILLMLAALVFTIRNDDKTDVEGPNTFNSNVDLLAYTLFNYDAEETSLVLYDPQSGVSTLFLADIDFRDFSFRVDGHLAFSSTQEGTAPDLCDRHVSSREYSHQYQPGPRYI